MNQKKINNDDLYNIIINNTSNTSSKESKEDSIFKALFTCVVQGLEGALNNSGGKITSFKSCGEVVEACNSFSSIELPNLNLSDVLKEFIAIDKLSLTLALKESDCKKLIKQLEANDRAKIKKIKKRRKGKYKDSYQLTTKKVKKIKGTVYIGSCPTYSKLRNLKIEFNPSNSRKAVTLLFKELSRVVGCKKAEKLTKGARITRVDLALDIYGSHVRDFLLIKPRCRYHEAYLSSVGLNTTYHGKRGACRVITYDKRTEMGLSQNTDKENSLSHTRIESQFRPYRFPKTSEGVKLESYKRLPSLLQFINIYNIKNMPKGQKDLCLIMQLTGHALVRKILTRAEWQQFSKSLKEFEVTLDHVAIKQLQNKLIKRELKRLIKSTSIA